MSIEIVFEGQSQTLQAFGKTYPCHRGKDGLVEADQKQEGDGKTPLGVYTILAGFFRPDIYPIAPHPAMQALTLSDGWCDDASHPLYNQRIQKPFSGRHETLWRLDHFYDLVLTLDHNTNPVIPNFGSAIFIHTTRARDALEPSTTEGCLRLLPHDLWEICQHIRFGQTCIQISP